MRRLIIAFLVLCGAAWGTACPGSYANWHKITIPANIPLSGNLSNFPMLWLGTTFTATVANGGQAQLSTLVDVVFCDGNNSGNLLPYELVANTATPTTGAGEWYVLVPTVSNTSAQVIYYGVGNAGASDLSTPHAVWASYQLVMHHGTASTLTLTDSTGNSTPSNNGATAVAGKINGGANYVSGSTQWIDTGLTPTSVTAFTLEGWVAPTSTANSFYASSRDAGGSNGIFMCDSCGSAGDASVGYSANSGGGYAFRAAGSLGSAGTAFTYIAGTHTAGSNNQVLLYLNGISVTGTLLTSGTNNDPGTSTNTLRLGRDGVRTNYLSSKQDELRLSYSVRSADWISATNLSIANPTCFYTTAGVSITCPVPVTDKLPQVVQTCFGNGAPSNTSTCIFNNNVTSGNALLCGAHFNGTISTISDTLTDSYTLIDSNTATSESAYVWKTVAGSTGANTVTVSGTATLSKGGIICFELPAALGSTVDAHSSGSYSSALAQITTSSVTTTTNGDFLLCYVSGNNSNGRLFANYPFTPQQGSGSDSNGAAWIYTGANGSYNCAFDNSTASNSAGGYITVALKPAALTIDTTALPTGALTNAYGYTLQARGGAGTYTWSITSGTLPSGLTLDSGTGIISGTPTTGTSTATFQVSDGTNTATASLTLTVNSSAGTVSFVQAVTGSTSGSLTSVSTGDCIVAVATGIPNGGIFLPTDGLGTIYRLAGGMYGTTNTGSTSATGMFLFAGKATSSGADTVSMPGSGVVIAQFSGCQLFLDELGFNAGWNQGVATLTGLGVPTVSPNSEIWAAVIGDTSTSTWNAGAGFTADGFNSGAASRIQGEHGVVSSPGATPPTFAQTSNTDGNWVINAIALRPTTSGVVNTNHRRAWVISK